MIPTRAMPSPGPVVGRLAARALLRSGHVLAALEVLHHELGDVFRLPLPGFDSVMLVGPEANRFLLVDAKESVLWRAEADPVTRLLRQGLLVTDGAAHDQLRAVMTPALHKILFDGYVQTMWQAADRVASQWRDGECLDLFAQMRRIALLILTETLFSDDFGPHMHELWRSILRTLRYISPGPWLLWPGMPRPGYQHAIRRLEAYLNVVIARRRSQSGTATDLLGRLIAAGLSDDLIRDQLLTMFIAGHDTSTALLAWSLYLLATHPETLERVRAQVAEVLGDQPPTYAQVRELTYLDAVIKETLRLYPPIHVGSRIAAVDLDFQGFPIPAGTRVLYSIYLTHRDRRYWPVPDQFDPGRFVSGNTQQRAYTYLPFGGGPRNCIGASFAQAEAKVVLARLLQGFALRFAGGHVRPRMRATLEPYPAVLTCVRRRPACTAPIAQA